MFHRNTVSQFVFALFLVIPSLAQAGQFCVGNFSNISLTWSLRTPGKNVEVFEQAIQAPGQEWQCFEFNDSVQYEVEVSDARFKYSEPSCLTTVKAGQWMKVTDGNSTSKLHFICEHLSEAGPISDVKSETAGAEIGWELRGISFANGPVQGASISVWNKEGKLVAERKKASDKDGYFTLPLKAPLLNGFRVEAKNGSINGKAFRGSLLVHVDEKFDVANDLIHLNIPSTLVEAYELSQPDLNHDVAEARVRHFLKIGDSVDFDFGVEGNYYKPFSVDVFARQAQQNGNWNEFIRTLVGEMASSEDNVHSFAQPKLLGDATVDYVGGKLLEGALKQGAASAFTAFSVGVGLPDTAATMIGLLKETLARLAEIKDQISVVETAVKESEYDIRAGQLYKEYATNVDKVLKQIQALNVIANKDVQGAQKEEVKAKGLLYRNEIIKNGLNFISNTSAEFSGGGKVTPLQKVWSEYQRTKSGGAISYLYFKEVSEQLEMYRGYMEATLAFLVDADRASGDKIALESDTKLGMDYLQPLKVILPEEKDAFFKNANDISLVKAGRAIADLSTRKMWDTAPSGYQTCEIFLKAMKDSKGRPNAYRAASHDDIGFLIGHSNAHGKIFAEASKKMGFPTPFTRASVIVTSCWHRDAYPANDTIAWFGGDQTWEWRDFNDSYSRLRNVLSSKGFNPSFFYSLVYRDM